ncbi:MAG: DNA integrity scanning diadenylate cyclase DisA [Firmicutes bacterium]|nr:DNA integrity scanning diadenylate cyclase DisA [Bacillota bacterium]
MKNERRKESDIIKAIKTVAPGTSLREGLESILKAKTGGLIVVGDTPQVMHLVDGGFEINKEYTPSYIYELAKMDGAIILSRDAKKILIANAQLIPDSMISTSETGTRHRTADRVAKQTGELVVAISQRRNVITLYKDQTKYILNDTGRILTRANQALQTLEKYKTALDDAMVNLSVLEFEDMVTLYDVIVAVQRTELVMRIVQEINKYIYALGNEGRLVSMQLEELVNHVEEDGVLIGQDYCIGSQDKSVEAILKEIRSFSQEELWDFTVLSRALGYGGSTSVLDMHVSPKGYRMLSKVPRVPFIVISNVVSRFKNFQSILSASTEELEGVEGIGEVRAKTIKESLRKIQNQLLLGNRRI